MTQRTVVQALEDAAVSTRTGYRFISEGTASEPFFTYSGLERATARYAGALQTLGLKKGDRVALVIPDNQDFVFTFLGALRAGVIPVPIYPPAGLRKLGGYLTNTLHVVRQSGAKVLVTDPDVRRLLGTVQAGAPDLEKVVSIEGLRKSNERLRPVSVGLDDTCFLQFTSGSTSAPKGVEVSHGNIAHNVEAFMKKGLGVQDGVDSGVSWLPLYHDMGLIGFVLGPLYHRNTVSFLPPLLFLKRPLRWLQTISRLRATVSFGPNFAYALCTKRVRDRDLEPLDLSSWRVAGCGAEPIRAANLEAFAEKFAVCGFQRKALLPCYGMAEATLAISFDKRGLRVDPIDGAVLAAEGRAETVADANDARALSVVSCGQAFEGHRVRVFSLEDEESRHPLPDRTVGEIRVQGPSVTTGYFDDPETTAAAFAGGWLKTGDLGYLVDGDIYVCGREKELIIVNGRNYYPQDLEWEASRVRGVRKGNVIAFGTTKPMGDRERVIIAFETGAPAGPEREEMKEGVRRTVRTATGLSIDDVVALEIGVLPKTSSGKLKRGETRVLYERGELFGRTSARQGDPIGLALEVAKSQLGYVKNALRRGGAGVPPATTGSPSGAEPVGRADDAD
ncbi:MAG: fatty acyl-AMP ligase [Myxococcota bacterium]